METKILLKDDNHYKELTLAFMRDAKLDKVSEFEKKKFIALCVVNKLNPYKKEVYAVPYGDKLQMTVAYTTYIERAEASGQLTGWTLAIKKNSLGVVIGAGITIHRKGRVIPFHYEATLEELKNDTNPLWKSNTTAMVRKQIIKIGFSLCFPENCGRFDYQDAEILDGENLQQPELEFEPSELIKVEEKIDDNVLEEVKDEKIVADTKKIK